MPPNVVVKFVEPAVAMPAERRSVGGIQIGALNSVLPAAVSGCGRVGSMR
ncbi:hypothetical protein [Mycobacterium montefiorense]|nr:hypothetical protein [Mycobacterium montefiorense]MCV7426896.1 hypothetical protein [Mycobacterium montefiorense]